MCIYHRVVHATLTIFLHLHISSSSFFFFQVQLSFSPFLMTVHKPIYITNIECKSRTWQAIPRPAKPPQQMGSGGGGAMSFFWPGKINPHKMVAQVGMVSVARYEQFSTCRQVPCMYCTLYWWYIQYLAHWPWCARVVCTVYVHTL